MTDQENGGLLAEALDGVNGYLPIAILQFLANKVKYQNMDVRVQREYPRQNKDGQCFYFDGNAEEFNRRAASAEYRVSAPEHAGYAAKNVVAVLQEAGIHAEWKTPFQERPYVWIDDAGIKTLQGLAREKLTSLNTESPGFRERVTNTGTAREII